MAREYEIKQPIPRGAIFGPESAIFEDFSGQMLYGIAAGGAAYKVYKDPRAAMSGVYGLRIENSLTQAYPGNYAGIYSFAGLWISPRLEITHCFNPHENVYEVDIVFQFPRKHTNKLMKARVVIRRADGNVYVYNGDFAKTLVGSFGAIEPNTWYKLTWSINCVAEKYINVRLGDKIIDCSAVSLYYSGDACNSGLMVFYTYNETALTATLFLDHFLVRALPG